MIEFSRILENICWIYLNVSQIVESGRVLKTRKIAENSRISRISTGYQSRLYTGYHELSPLASAFHRRAGRQRSEAQGS